MGSLDVEALSAEYATLRENAPRRSLADKVYFVGHTGMPSASARSNRLEEHYAIALLNLGRRWPRIDGGWFRLLDYQVPLKARRTDGAVGKIDLLGITDRGRLVIIELKVEGEGGGRSDPPPAALMEALRYAAMVEADLDGIASEAERRFGVNVERTPPIVQLLAPVGWWRAWLSLGAAGEWGPPFVRLGEEVTARTGVAVECLALEDVGVFYGVDGRAPRLAPVPRKFQVRLGQEPPFGEALQVSPTKVGATKIFFEQIHRTLWNWADRHHADRHHADRLDGGSREGRPPVLTREYATLNVLVPPDPLKAEEIRGAIPPAQRHRHFASLRSSQALTQSVFGAIAAFDRLDILDDVKAECGRPAFSNDHRGWRLELEHEVHTLGEPRPTSVDVLLSGSQGRVAIECKFTELEFGTCSRPRLQPGDAGYAAQHCDGTYRRQAGRGARCSLTSIGVRYWDHLPQLFDWPADRDHEPCPFGFVYQLARNVLAAVVTREAEIEPSGGHALVLYDARNPTFQVGGEADRQWETALAACLVPALIRRLSWQRLLGFIGDAAELTWLVDALREKYGLVPERRTDRR